MESRRYVQYALLTATGAVLGLLLIRSRSASASLAFEALSNRSTYVYLFAVTAAVFLGIGYVLGRRLDRFRQFAMTDPLTGLANRRALQVRLRDEEKRAFAKRSPLSILLIDIDGLKQINDRQGHAAGDHVLQTAAHAIESTVRETDLGARWGGDEFAIVAPDTTPAMAHRLAHRLIRELEQRARNREADVTVAVGVATLDPDDGDVSVDALVNAADAALYRAKRDGRNQVNVA